MSMTPTPQSLDTVTLEAAAKMAAHKVAARLQSAPSGWEIDNEEIYEIAHIIFNEVNEAALAIKPTPAGEGEELLGYVNVYRTEDGTLEMGATDFYETPQDAKDGDASEFEEVVGVGKVTLLSSSAPAASPVAGGGEDARWARVEKDVEADAFDQIRILNTSPDRSVNETARKIAALAVRHAKYHLAVPAASPVQGVDGRRIKFADRLARYAAAAYEAMSQGGDHRIPVSPEFAEDMIAATHLARSNLLTATPQSPSTVDERVREALKPFAFDFDDRHPDDAIVSINIDFTREEAEALNREIDEKKLPIKKANIALGQNWPQHCLSLDSISLRDFRRVRALLAALDASREK